MPGTLSYAPPVITIDVEDWPQSSWDRDLPITQRAADNTRRLLELLARAGVRATMFVLGKLAERFPELVREIDAAGHEVASHGYGHVEIFKQTRDEFAADLQRSKDFLEQIVGQARARVSSPRLFDRPRLAVGPRRAGRAGIRVRFEHFSGQAAALWHSRLAAGADARAVGRRQEHPRVSDRQLSGLGQELAGGRRRISSAAARRGRTLVGPARDAVAAVRVLLPSLRIRSARVRRDLAQAFRSRSACTRAWAAAASRRASSA